MFIAYPTSARADDMVRRAGPARHQRLVLTKWTFAESFDVKGNAHCNPYTKQIVFHPRCAGRRSKRDIYYVTEHEVGHALDFNAGLPSKLLANMIGLNDPSAQECLAEAVAYWSRKSTSERAWILSSIAWHAKAGIKWRYKWSDVRNPRTIELANMLVYGPGQRNGKYFVWQGDKIVAVAPAGEPQV